MATLSPDLLAAVVLTAPDNPDPPAALTGLRCLADYTAGLWSHSFYWLMPAAILALLGPFLAWPPLLAGSLSRTWRQRAHYLIGLRHRESDNSRALARTLRFTRLHMTALAHHRTDLLPLLPSIEPLVWSSSLRLRPDRAHLAVTGWPHPAGCFGGGSSGQDRDFLQLVDYLGQLADCCARSVNPTVHAAPTAAAKFATAASNTAKAAAAASSTVARQPQRAVADF